MRVVFFGTPDFAVPSLQALLQADIDIALVVTQPDHGLGHLHKTPRPPAVKLAAEAAGLPIAQPERPRGDDFTAQLRALDADLGVVVAYGHLLQPDLLAIPKLGFVNVHASLLPRWRGAAPIHWAVRSGDAETGVAIMRVEAGLDSGGVWRLERTPISDTDTTGELFGRLARLGATALVATLTGISAGDTPTPQNDALVTQAPKISRDIARVPWNDSATAVSCHIRAMDPRPGAWSTIAGQEMKLFGPRVVKAAPGLPGSILDTNHHLVVACTDGALEIAEVQPAGKRRMTSLDWIRGSGTAPGARFE